mgnify:CR=1 FL=1
MEIKNTINNIKVTVEYDTHEDMELTMALNKLTEAKNDFMNADKFYTPKIEAMGEAKWMAICEQLKPLLRVMQEAKIDAIRVFYSADDTAIQYSIAINANTERMYFMGCGWNENLSITHPTFSPNNSLQTFGISKAGFITRWEEYNIYTNLRNKLIHRIEEKTERMNFKTKSLVDHFADVRDHN